MADLRRPVATSSPAACDVAGSAGPGVAVIEGPGERYIQEGSVLTLVCWVRHAAADAPQRLAWFHGTKRLSYDSPRGGVSIQVRQRFNLADDPETGSLVNSSM